MKKTLALVVVCISFLQWPSARAQANKPEDASSAVAVLNSVSNALQQSHWRRGEKDTDPLVAVGPAAAPLLAAELKRPRNSAGYRDYLMDAFARMPASPGSTKALLDLALTAPDDAVQRRAGALLRAMNRRIDFPLTEQQAGEIVRRIRQEQGFIAAGWALALARATNAYDESLIGPLIERLERAVPEAQNMPPLHGAYTSVEAAYPFQFARVFEYLLPQVAIPILKREIASTHESRVLLWLKIAAGMAGDSTVGNDLLQIVNDENASSSLRSVALRSYARAAPEQAIPVLEGFRFDRTPGPSPRYPPLSVAAQDELARLRHPPAK